MADNDNPNNSNNPRAPNSILMQQARELAEQLRTPGIIHAEKQRKHDFHKAIIESQLPDETLRRLNWGTQATSAFRVNTLSSQLRVSSGARIEGYNVEMAHFVAREFSERAVNSQVKEALWSPGSTQRAMQLDPMTNEELRQREKEIEARRVARTQEATKAARNLFTTATMNRPNQYGRKDILEQLSGFEVEQRADVQELAAIRQQMQKRRIAGTDPKSMEAASFMYMEKAREMGIFGGDSGNKAIDSRQALEEFKKSMKEAAEALEELKSATTDAAKATAQEKHHAKISEAGEAYEKYESSNKARATKYARYAAIAQNVGILGSTIQDFNDMDIRQMRNRAGYANIENTKYSQYVAARQGDVASQMALLQWDKAQEFGRKKSQTNQVGGFLEGMGGGVAQMLGGAAMLSAGAALSATGIGATVGLPMIAAALAGGAGGAMLFSGASKVASQGVNTARGVDAGAKEIEATQAYMQAQQEVNAIPAQRMQTLRDFYTSSGMAARNLGGAAGNAFLKQVRDPALLGKIAAAGMSPEQVAQLSAQGIDQMGSAFNVNQTIQARGFERAGFGSAAMNMQRMAMLSNAGANNPGAGLESALSSAVERGLNSSTAINKMVEHTAQMAEQTGTATAMGWNTATQSGNLLASLVDPNLAKTNDIFAVKRAQTLEEMMRQATTNTDISFTGMLNTSRIQEVSGISGLDAITAGKKTTQEWRSLLYDEKGNKRSNKDIESKLSEAGIYGYNSSGEEFVNKMLDIDQLEIFEGRGKAASIIIDDKQRQRIFQTVKANGTLEGEDEKSFNRLAAHLGIAPEEFKKQIRAPKEPNSSSTLTPPKKEGDREDFEVMLESGAKQLAEAAESAAKSLNAAAKNLGLGESGDAVNFFKTLTQKIEEDGQAAEKRGEFDKMAAEAADKFKNSSGKFEKSVDKFSDLLANLKISSGYLISTGSVNSQDVRTEH